MTEDTETITAERVSEAQTAAGAEKPREVSQLCLLVAAGFVWTAAYCGFGKGSSFVLGMVLLVLGIVICAWGIAASRRRNDSSGGEAGRKFRASFIVAAAAIQLGAVGWMNARMPAYLWIFWVPALTLLALAGLLRLLQWLSRHKEKPEEGESKSIAVWKMFFWTAVVLHLATALTFVMAHSGAFIDVYLFQRDGAQALLHGIDPYTITHANVYPPKDAAKDFPEGVLWGGRVHWGYNYLPVSLFFALPGYLLGDVRYSQIAAVILSALLLVKLRSNRMTIAAACFLLLSPITFGVEMNSWIEPSVLLALTLTVYAAVRRSWWMPLAFGFFLASKQYSVIGVPFFFFLQPFGWKYNLKILAKSAALATLVTAPLALWNLRSFIRDTILLFLRRPSRTDSLSLGALAHLPPWMVWGLIAAAVLLCLLSAARTPALFAASFSFVLLIFMFVSTQAFANYYFLIAHSLWLAVAASDEWYKGVANTRQFSSPQ
jgi:hypothetical protein